MPGVTGVGLGEDSEGKEVIVIFVSQSEDLDAMRTRVPEVLDGYRTDVRPEVRVFPGQEGEERSGH